MDDLFLLPTSNAIRWTGLVGSSAAFSIAHAFSKTSKPVFVVGAQERAMRTLMEDVKFFQQLFHLPSKKLLFFPARKTVRKYSQIEEATVTGERLQALHALLNSPENVVVFSNVEAVSQITIAKEMMQKYTGLLVAKASYERETLVRELVEAGYEKDIQVLEPGSFAVRGSILDVYSPNYDLPVRIEFFGDEIESIRFFDMETQRSTESLEEFVWVPSQEALVDAGKLEAIEQRLKSFCDEKGIAPRIRLELIESMREGRYESAAQLLMPLFYEKKTTVLDYLPKDASFALVDPFLIEREEKELEEQYEKVVEDQGKNKVLACPPSMHVVSFEALAERLGASPCLEVSDISIHDSKKTDQEFRVFVHHDLRQNLAMHKRKENPIAPFLEVLRSWEDQGYTRIIVSPSETGVQRLQSLLKPYFPKLQTFKDPKPTVLQEAKTNVCIVLGELSFGFGLPDKKLAFVTEADLFGERKHVSSAKQDASTGLSDLKELSPGDYIVHLDHGVGIYRGLERIKVNKTEGDFLLIEYAEKDKLFLPIYRLNRVHKYVGADGRAPSLDRLGNPQAWEKARSKAQKAVEEMAHELIALYAARQVSRRKSYAAADPSYIAFEEDFPFEETRDQLRTLEEVEDDLLSEKAMDRLVCGDVGFGKTEIALRAAFRTAMEGLQTAVLVPTTILAQQHYETFKRRMEKYPVKVDFVSRFKSAKEQKEVVEQLKEGKLDIVVGTHRLLSKDVSFKNLGLLVLDEEHRFGVKHKEAIKQYRNLVHVLTLTATPIPRTLQLSMAGIRDLSVINTPPMDRKSVDTILCRFDDEVIASAIEKELSRGGQVFFLHNRVETIDAMAVYIKKLVPKARIGIGHAQMDEKRLEETMLKFLNKEFDVLLCTTIVESGLDIPNANTMMINRADCFGLAQLYQLRGRVGRSDRSAYCYLLIPGEDIISKDAMKRLKALKRFTDLGSGLKIALHDLEIRGAGNLLGSQQSGHISDVGFELYSQLLEREIRRLKGQKTEEEIEPEIQTSMPAFLPETYVPDSQERLILYKRLSGTKTDEELEKIKQELLDRFGKLPPTAENLVEVIELKILARTLGIASLKLAGDYPLIEFTDRANINIDKLLAMVKKDKRMKLRPDQKLALEIPSDYNMVEETKKVLLSLRNG